jgi:SAM-dependent methyltransferase
MVRNKLRLIKCGKESSMSVEHATTKARSQSQIIKNIKIHNKISKRYAKAHGEIYNDIEQLRIRLELSNAISTIKNRTFSSKLRALDFGCGAGNLTKHLLDLNCEVIACDVSEGFLDLIGKTFEKSPVETFKLNGVDLSGIPSESVDLVATYSVLHHIPDYLRLIGEFIRVLRPGGIIYLDHEPSEEYWKRSDHYLNFIREMKPLRRIDWRKYICYINYIDFFIRKFIDPRYQREGDIHVFDDDHVEWPKIRAALNPAIGNILYEKSYLLFRRGYEIQAYLKYMDQTSDMHCLVFQKHCQAP